jgi:hypothetical protein
VNRAQRSACSDRTEIGRQHGAILQALDKLFELEVSRGGKPALRLVRPGETIDRNHEGEEVRAFLFRCGWDL